MGLFGKTKQKDQDLEQMKVLLGKLEFSDLEKLCKDVIGRTLQSQGNERPERIHFLEFIWNQYNKKSLSFQQVKDFALKNSIVDQSFFE